MKKILYLILGYATVSFGQNKIPYPKTDRKSVTDIYFDTFVTDQYRWLEDDYSQETSNWVKAQNQFTFSYLDQIPFRDKIKSKIEELFNHKRISIPFKEGNYTYYYENSGLENQSVLYREDKKGKKEVFLDPNSFTKDGSISLTNLEFSKNGKFAAYSISEAGTDWNKIIIIDVITKKRLEQPIVNVKFSKIVWFNNDGFYYSAYDNPKENQLFSKTEQHKLYYHKLGTDQKEDKVIFGQNEIRRYVSAAITEDGKYLIIYASNSTTGNELYVKELNVPNSKIVNIIDNFDSDSYVLNNQGSKLYIVTNMNAPNQKIITVDVSNPKPENWKDFIKETENLLTPSTGSGYIFTHYMKDVISNVKQYDYEGNLIREIQLPGFGTVGGFHGKKDDKVLYFTFSNYIVPESIYAFNVKTGTSTLYYKRDIKFDSFLYESKQIFYTSKDGTKIPMIITHKKGLKLDGNNPTILYGYGGFNISLTPEFSITNAVWLENGGVYAVPNLRGGGEYGKKWHNAGIRLQKQNVFDDFIAAAEYLIKEKYTSSSKLAIRGRSNGGLLVGAVMTQRPDLMKVAIPEVGVLDMLRYHTFTAGAGWDYDYGTASENKEMFTYLKGYSPVHNVKENLEYPATLVTTADHDDRVVPSHSFKFIAELQSKNPNNKNPLLIRVETNAGHGSGIPTSKIIEKECDIQSFIIYNMGILLK